MVLISVVVPTLNEEKFIERTLEALQDQTLPKHEYEIIVSDSSSNDSTVEIAKGLADKVVICDRVSAGFGRNFGAKHAKGKLLVFIDADTIANPRYLEGAKEALSKWIAATGPVRALEKDDVLLRLFFRYWSFNTRLSLFLRYPIFPGFNFAVRKSVFEQAQGFITQDITTEDLELSLRLCKYGKLGYNKKMLVYTSTRRLREISIPSYVANGVKYILFKKCHSWSEHRQDFSQIYPKK